MIVRARRAAGVRLRVAAAAMGRGEKHILLGPHSSYPGMCSINKTKNVGLAFNPQILCPNALVGGQVKLEDLKLSILTSQGCSQGEH